MKKFITLTACALFAATCLMAQETPKKKKKVPDMSNRPNDHLLLQVGYTAWSGQPDTVYTKGFSKSINGYFMFDFPFKTNPNLSMAAGVGIASDHILFSKTHVGIKDNVPTIPLADQSDTNHFKKTKLATVYLEAPFEFRYSAQPLTGKGLKFALGIKVGMLVNAHTRNVRFEDKNANLLNDYTMKETSKKFFNKTRLSAMARVGVGHFSVFGSYQLSALFKDGFGPEVKPFTIGLTLSGL